MTIEYAIKQKEEALTHIPPSLADQKKNNGNFEGQARQYQER